MSSRTQRNRRTFGFESLEWRNAPSGLAHLHALATVAHRELPDRTPEVHKLETHIPEKTEVGSQSPAPASPDTTPDPSPDR